MAQEDTVEVQLKDFLFAECALNLDSEQYFVELAHKGAIEVEEVVTRHLHG